MKYILTKKYIEHLGKKLFQIKALTDFGDVKKGDLGGYIESEKNLSQKGIAWISGNALVYDNAWVFGDARVFGDAQVYGNALVSGDAQVYGKVKVKTILCSRFNFESDWQIELWQKKEMEFLDESTRGIKK